MLGLPHDAGVARDPGGYGLLMASGTVDELIFSEIGNEVLLIKYVDPDPN
jgi:hypothetical protein